MSRRSIQGYDRLASLYRPIERCVFGDRLQQARTALLDQIPQWDRMLILGDGDGRLLQKIVNSVTYAHPRSPPREIISLDQSSRMLDRQRERITGDHPHVSVKWIQADALQYRPPTKSFDVIVTPFFLDCFSEAELREAMPAWHAGLRHRGIWYHIDFVIPHLGWRRARAILLVHAMHLFFRATTGLENRELVNTGQLFEQLSMQAIARVRGDRDLIESTIYRSE